jgi:hypothetical protein
MNEPKVPWYKRHAFGAILGSLSTIILVSALHIPIPQAVELGKAIAGGVTAMQYAPDEESAP